MIVRVAVHGTRFIQIKKKRNNGITPAATSNLDSIAIRVPSNPIILKILNTVLENVTNSHKISSNS